MGGLTGAVHWWEEWQLRVLVLSSLGTQFVLFGFTFLRRFAIPGWFRSIMWLAYLGGDAVAIYALATLFNRHKLAGEHGGGGSSSSTLEVVWAPVLLLHLAGQDGITAYNIEDNELWTRHLVTAVSQVTVAIYAFCKSWPPGGDKKLLKAAIMLFVLGVLRCLAKPWAFKGASINNLVNSSPPAVKQNGSEVYTLEEYVQLARDFAQQEQKDEGEAQGTSRSTTVVAKEDRRRRRGSMTREEHEIRSKQLEHKQRGDISKLLFVDLSSSYSHRLRILKRLWTLKEERAYGSIREGLASSFFAFYTRLETSAISVTVMGHIPRKASAIFKFICVLLIQDLRMTLPWAAIGLFHKSHREDYDDIDVKITYALFCCTAFLEMYSFGAIAVSTVRGDPYASSGKEQWPEMVAQYSLMQFFARNKRHSKKMWITNLVGCKDLLDKHWCMKSRSSSERITELVLGYLKDGWKETIHDVASYLRFNDHSRHWVLEQNRRSSHVLGLISIRRPFDESVLLWHMATDFCFFLSSFSEHRCAFAEDPILSCVRDEFIEEARRREMEAKIAPGTSSSVENNQSSTSQSRQEEVKSKAKLCRQMSNYMVYLLFVNPEMLLPGTRRKLFTDAYGELKDILPEDKKPSLFATAYKQVKGILLEDNKRNVYRRVTAAFKEMKDILRDNKRNPLSWSQWKAAPVKEEFLMERLIRAMLDKPKQASEEELKEGHIQGKAALVKEESFIERLIRRRKQAYEEKLKEGHIQESNVYKTCLLDGQKRVLFRGTYWLRQWAKLQRSEDQRDLLIQIGQHLETQALQFFGSNGWLSNRSIEKLVDAAWALAQRLLDSNKGNEKKMWEEIERVWVEMLCFSASRCRGYLHAKALGNGGEFLSYIWLLLFYMGMETFTDKLQRQEHQSWGGNNGAAPAAPLVPEVRIDVAPSNSEIHMAAQDMD